MPTISGLAPDGSQQLEQEQHACNSALAQELMDIIEAKLKELGIRQFWDMANIGRNSVQTQRNMIVKLPAKARARCLQVIQSQLDAMHIPEGLRHRCSDPQDAASTARAFRRAAEVLSEEVQLKTWQSCGLQLFACADPM